MAINLQKGQKISLSKDGAGNALHLSQVLVGLGWDAAPRRGLFGGSTTPDIDCDASMFLLRGGKLVDRADIVYYGNLRHRSGAVRHTGDNLTGDGDGDDEQILVDLNLLPPDVDRVVITVTIYGAERKKQDFGMIENAFMRLVDMNTKQELARFNLTDNYAGATAMVFGEIYRHNGEWKLNAIGQGTHDGSITELANKYR